jgi:hypothetical protein
MKASTKNQSMRVYFISSLLAGVFCLSANAGLYTFNDSGVIPQGGATFSAEHPISDPASTITSIELILTFNDSASLGSTMLGTLNLGTGTGSPSVSLSPTFSYNSGVNSVYDVTFTGTSGTPGSGFNGLNPNDTWGLVLWDTGNNGIQNSLVGWSLDIEAVPEPVNVALGIFGGLLATVVFGKKLKLGLGR